MNELFCRFALIATLVTVANCAKINVRYGGKVPEARCRRVMYWHPGGVSNFFHAIGQILTYKANCTDIKVMDTSAGHALENGSYTGMQGYLQRGDAEFILNFARSDLMPFDTFVVGSPALAADVAIVSMTRTRHSVDNDVTNVLGNFNWLNYVYMAIVAHIVLALTVARPHQWENVSSYESLCQNYLSSLWGAFELLVDQENLTGHLRSWSKRIVWCAAVTGTFVLVFGYFWNLLSTDATVQPQVRQLDSLEDQLSEHFKDVKPTIVKNYYAYGILKSSFIRYPKSLLGRYYRLLNEHSDNGIVELSMSSVLNGGSEATATGNRSLRAVNNFLNGTQSVSFPREFYTGAALTAGCIYRPDIVLNLTLSKSTFANGNLHFVFSKHADPLLNKYLDYRARNAFEFGLVRHTVRGIGSSVEELTGKERGNAALKCMEEQKGFTAFWGDEKEVQRLGMFQLRKVFFLISYAATFSLMVIFCELIARCKLSVFLINGCRSLCTKKRLSRRSARKDKLFKRTAKMAPGLSVGFFKITDC